MTLSIKDDIMKLIKEQKQELNNNKNSSTVYPRIIILLFDCVVLIMLMKNYKTKLKLNNKQRTQLFKNAGVARFAYNLALQIQEENYKNGGIFLSDCDIRKQITILKQNELNWLYDFSCDIVKQSVKEIEVKEVAIIESLAKSVWGEVTK